MSDDLDAMRERGWGAEESEEQTPFGDGYWQCSAYRGARPPTPAISVVAAHPDRATAEAMLLAACAAADDLPTERERAALDALETLVLGLASAWESEPPEWAEALIQEARRAL